MYYNLKVSESSERKWIAEINRKSRIVIFNIRLRFQQKSFIKFCTRAL